MKPVSHHLRQHVWFWRAAWPPLLLAAAAGLLAWLSPWIWLSGLAGLGVVLLLFDSRARHRQFLAMRRLLHTTGSLSGTALARFRQARCAWCTRNAVLAAAQAEGLGRAAREMVHDWGYRPWHVFPDGAFSARSPFLRASFWHSVLGLGRLRRR